MSKTLFPGFDHQSKPVDPCAGKHGGAETSEEAFASIESSLGGDCAAAYRFIVERNGATCKEFAAYANKPLHAVSGRFSSLLLAKLIRPSGIKRDNSREMVPNRK